MDPSAHRAGREVEPEDGATGGQGTPLLALEGFSGPLDHLLTLARAQKINLAGLSVSAIVEQLAVALQQAPAAVSLGQKGDWVVMAAWLLQLCSRLFLPADASAHQDAAREAAQVRGQLVALEAMQALAGWLDRRPQLGQDVFARGRPPSRLSLAPSVAQSPEVFGVWVDAGQAVDGVEFLWASLALFDDEPGPETRAVYRPRPLELYTVAEARERILRLLAEEQDGAPLDCFLPDPPEVAASEQVSKLRRRSAWASTLIAGLELARQGDVALEQVEAFTAIHIRSLSGGKTELVPDEV